MKQEILQLIKVKETGKYSPNLYRYLNSKKSTFLSFIEVYKHEDGALWIGFDGDYEFIGCKIINVLCEGKNAQSGAYVGVMDKLTKIDRFWDDYVDIGRCAIDVNHSMLMRGDESRWLVEDDTRRCQWCNNHTQNLKRWTETIEREKWIKL